jgi:hypothetical protein
MRISSDAAKDVRTTTRSVPHNWDHRSACTSIDGQNWALCAENLEGVLCQFSCEPQYRSLRDRRIYALVKTDQIIRDVSLNSDS